MVVNRAANSDTFEVTTPSDTEIQMTRLFDAPRQLVYEVLTRPEHVRRWWGLLDENYSVPICEIDLRVGGKWRFVSKGPEGEVAFSGVYKEIVPNERLVHTEIFEAYPTEESLVTNVLADEGGKTRLTVVAAYSSLQTRDLVLKSGMEHGAAIGYDHMERIASELARR